LGKQSRRTSLRRREFKEIGHVEQAKDQPNNRRHGTTLLVVEEVGTREPQSTPLRLKFTTALCQNIANPLTLASIRKSDDDSLAILKK
jgi:hypothetical protein